MSRVLIVDDSPVMRRNLVFILSQAGHEIVAQGMDGAQAYHLYKTHSPDIVTMDISMPEVNGIEGVRRIIKDFPDAKIIMVSALNQKEMVLEALKFGAKHYIIKPVNPEKLLSVINKVLGIVLQPNPETAVKQESPLQLKRKIMELEAANLQLKQLSTLDGLTGIPNRRHFDSILENEWKSALEGRTSISLLMIDIDFFKNYNDSQGHLAGDECIKKIAKLIAGNLKGASDIAARYGGEEFSVILPGIDGIGAFRVAERIRKSVERAKLEHPASSISKYVTLSIGVASVIPNTDIDVNHFLRMADGQLYLAKQRGRNRASLNLEDD